MIATSLEKLKRLYEHPSKHSNYQELPSRLRAMLPIKAQINQPRHDIARLQFISENLNVKDTNILDIGANTGFFSFEMLERGASATTLYEGNIAHSDFIRICADVLGVADRLTVLNRYYNFKEKPPTFPFDIILLLNVLHHVGDDFSSDIQDVNIAHKFIADGLRHVLSCGKYTIFQLGYCWKGDRNRPLFRDGTKSEQISFVEAAISGIGRCVGIGIAEINDGVVQYVQPNLGNMQRDDNIGEFLNRPLFIIESM